MKRINEAIAEKMNTFTRGQKLLATFISEHCDKAAFMSSFELAAYTGVSQSSVIRFSNAMGYNGYAEFQEALQTELKYRLTTLERFELLSEQPTDADVVSEIALCDARNIKKNAGTSSDALKNIATRIMLSSRVYVYGQGAAGAAAVYLSSYLRNMLPNISCINQLGIDPLSAVAQIENGDLLICISFPVHTSATIDMLEYAKSQDAGIVSISESKDSLVAALSDVSLVSECGDYGINGTLAPVISLCGAIISILARSDERFKNKLNRVGETLKNRR
ncbi:MAG: MurR/RpiR family transcriptional regulator [Clostridia bacterium]|nr:MurR/RpiR family transcriptional regulator [Clostridia bacterium]